jgi:hypothetical protein
VAGSPPTVSTCGVPLRRAPLPKSPPRFRRSAECPPNRFFRRQQIFQPRHAGMHQRIGLFAGDSGNRRDLFDGFGDFFFKALGDHVFASMSTSQPVSRPSAARSGRACRWPATTGLRHENFDALAWPSSTSMLLSLAGSSALVTNALMSDDHGITSTFSLFNSRTMFFTRWPRMPTHAPTGSTLGRANKPPSSCGNRARARCP